jgi:Spy/CpxP family protein refolding chaperone
MRRGPFGEGPEGGFGVRRPLRVLAYKLELDEAQIAELARLLDEVKTERAQGEVDDRRTLSEFADALAGETFDAAKAGAAGDRRVAAATRLRDTVVRFLQQIHAILRPDQRARLAYLIRTGTLIV